MDRPPHGYQYESFTMFYTVLRLLVFSVAAKRDRAAVRNTIQKGANNPDAVGRYHYDFADTVDADWSKAIKVDKNKTGIFIIRAGEFGQDVLMGCRQLAKLSYFVSSANAASSRIVKPRDSALERLDPAFSPARRKSVLLEIELDTFPPAASMSFLNSGRGLESVPVITNVFPAMAESEFCAADFSGS